MGPRRYSERPLLFLACSLVLGLIRLFHIPTLNAMKPSIFERMLLAAAAVALTLGLAYAAQATPTSSREIP